MSGIWMSQEGKITRRDLWLLSPNWEERFYWQIRPLVALLQSLKWMGLTEKEERSLDLESIMKYYNKEKGILIRI